MKIKILSSQKLQVLTGKHNMIQCTLRGWHL